MSKYRFLAKNISLGYHLYVLSYVLSQLSLETSRAKALSIQGKIVAFYSRILCQNMLFDIDGNGN